MQECWLKLIYAGCDLGILTAKAAVIRNGDVLAFEILPYRNLPRQAAVEVMDRALAAAGVTREDVEYCLATGLARKLSLPRTGPCRTSCASKKPS